MWSLQIRLHHMTQEMGKWISHRTSWSISRDKPHDITYVWYHTLKSRDKHLWHLICMIYYLLVMSYEMWPGWRRAGAGCLTSPRWLPHWQCGSNRSEVSSSSWSQSSGCFVSCVSTQKEVTTPMSLPGAQLVISFLLQWAPAGWSGPSQLPIRCGCLWWQARASGLIIKSQGHGQM
jgi:hypothetical protein